MKNKHYYKQLIAFPRNNATQILNNSSPKPLQKRPLKTGYLNPDLLSKRQTFLPISAILGFSREILKETVIIHHPSGL